ncbi:MAG: GspH/FimT family pseudopilin [Phycisphaeraceae bacterium]
MNRSRHPRAAAGMTLVEVTMVLLVLAIAAAMVAPLMGSTAASQLRSAAAMLVADLDAARLQSLTRGHDRYVVVFDMDANGYHLARASDPAKAVTHPVDAGPYVVRFGHGRAATLADVQITDVQSPAGDDAIAFGAFGQLTSDTPAIITLTADGGSLTITLDAVTGEATISDL